MLFSFGERELCHLAAGRGRARFPGVTSLPTAFPPSGPVTLLFLAAASHSRKGLAAARKDGAYANERSLLLPVTNWRGDYATAGQLHR